MMNKKQKKIINEEYNKALKKLMQVSWIHGFTIGFCGFAVFAVFLRFCSLIIYWWFLK